MGHSIQVYREKDEIINDLDLLIALRFLLSEIQERPSEYLSLSEGTASWRQCFRHYAPGAIEMDLDNLLRREEQRREFRTLLGQVRTKLEQMGPSIPAALLNNAETPNGVVFADYQTALVGEALKSLERLVGP
jgi:hypothetical protein